MKNEFRNCSDVLVFLAVVKGGSTLAASKKLGIAQPTVARRIDALEHEIGVTLFERDTRGFRPTEDARALIPMAKELQLAVSNFAAKAKDLTSTRPIRITAFSENFSPRVKNIFNEFSTLHPEIQFEILSNVKVLDLVAGEADIALRITRATPDSELICRRVSTAQFTLYGSESYAKKNGLPQSCDDLNGHCFVTFERDDVPPILHEWLLRHVTSDQIILSFSEIELMHAAIKAGHGLGIMNVKLAEDDKDLLRCFDAIEELSSEHIILVSPEAYRRSEVKAFTKFFAPRYAAIFK
jgi:DNA-binding transcriptional LysR family regulator